MAVDGAFDPFVSKVIPDKYNIIKESPTKVFNYGLNINPPILIPKFLVFLNFRCFRDVFIFNRLEQVVTTFENLITREVCHPHNFGMSSEGVSSST